MGLLNSLLDFQGGLMARREAARAKALQKIGLLPPSVDYQQQAVGLARQLGRSGYGPTEIGGQPTPEQAAGQTATGLMMDPNTREIGVQQAQGLLGQLGEQAKPTMRAQLERERADLQGKVLGNVATALGISAFPEQQQLERKSKEAYIANLSFDNAVKASGAKRQLFEMNVKNEADLRKELNSDPVVVKGQQAINSFDQMDRALEEDNFIALQAAIVGLAQVQEPGLAVRNDDRIAYSGNNSMVAQLVNMYNRYATGEVVDPVMVNRMRALGMQLASVNAKAFTRVMGEYRDLATKTPGIRPEMVTTGTGVDPAMLELLTSVP